MCYNRIVSLAQEQLLVEVKIGLRDIVSGFPLVFKWYFQGFDGSSENAETKMEAAASP